MTKTERLKELARLAGVRIVNYTDVFGVDKSTYPYVYSHMEGNYTYRQDEHTRFEWTLDTELGRLVIADRLYHGPNWPSNWSIDKSKNGGIRVVQIFEDWVKPEYIEEYHHIATKPTWAEAVIAAMEGKFGGVK
jgi:hypothetical protein